MEDYNMAYALKAMSSGIMAVRSQQSFK